MPRTVQVLKYDTLFREVVIKLVISGLQYVSANGDAPWICPIITFVRYLLWHKDTVTHDALLFEGSEQYKLYLTYFSRLLGEYKVTLMDIS